MTTTLLGHNAADIQVNVEVRLFNTISRYAGKDGFIKQLSLPAGSDINDILAEYNIPKNEVFLIFVNGRDITPELNTVRTTYVLEENDVVALSGPVPYSWGYGAPIV